MLTVEGSSEQVHGEGKVLRVDQGVEWLAHPFLAGQPGDGLERWIERAESSVCAYREDGVRGVVEQPAMVRRRLRGRGRVPALGQIVHVHAPAASLPFIG